MAHILPIKIECRYCLGDGFVTFGYVRIEKRTCPHCKGVKHEWISPVDLKDSDVVLR